MNVLYTQVFQAIRAAKDPSRVSVALVSTTPWRSGRRLTMGLRLFLREGAGRGWQRGELLLESLPPLEARRLLHWVGRVCGVAIYDGSPRRGGLLTTPPLL